MIARIPMTIAKMIPKRENPTLVKLKPSSYYNIVVSDIVLTQIKLHGRDMIIFTQFAILIVVID